MRVRKNYRSLTTTERDRFVQALFQLKTNGTVDQFAADHAKHFHHIHGTSFFLPWHREFIRRFEVELQKVHSDNTIPYWSSVLDATTSDPLWQDNFLGQFNSPWNLRRTLGADTLPTQAAVDSALAKSAFMAFSRPLEVSVHNPPHRWVGGVMKSDVSPGDPAFYLHHAWVDSLWALWQASHPGVPFEGEVGMGLHDPMAPWNDRTPANVLDHHALGYRYDFEHQPEPSPPIILDPSNYSFGEVEVGEEVSLTVTLKNVSANAVFVTVIRLTGPNPSDFSAVPNALNTLVLPGQTALIDLRFRPAGVGLRQASLVVASDKGSSPEMGLAGAGRPAPAPVEPPVDDHGVPTM